MFVFAHVYLALVQKELVWSVTPEQTHVLPHSSWDLSHKKYIHEANKRKWANFTHADVVFNPFPRKMFSFHVFSLYDKVWFTVTNPWYFIVIRFAAGDKNESHKWRVCVCVFTEPCATWSWIGLLRQNRIVMQPWNWSQPIRRPSTDELWPIKASRWTGMANNDWCHKGGCLFKRRAVEKSLNRHIV